MTDLERDPLMPARRALTAPAGRPCRKCGHPTFERYVDDEGAMSDVCAKCGHPRPGDPVVIHGLLNRRAVTPLARTCHVCGSEVKDACLCNTCVGNMRGALAKVSDLEPELETTLTKQANFERGQHVGGTPEPPLPLHLEAADAAENAQAILGSWMRLLEEEGLA